MKLLSANQQKFMLFLTMIANLDGLAGIDARIQLANVKLLSAKCDDTGWIIELNACNDSFNAINLFCNKILSEADTYGIKRYANRKSVALRVSLTGSI